MAQLHKRGVTAVLICSATFLPLARAQRAAAGVPELPLVVITHPLGGIPDSEVDLRVGEALPQLLALVRERVDGRI